ncbi:MAG TPA: M23 family metallopeptidase [Firmicutes bacterium]|nr:M23 family metallopeptidase [Bacillota bacterium]
MVIKFKLSREWLANKLPFKMYREHWQKRMKAARVSLRSAYKRLPWSRALTRKGVLYLSALLMTVVTVSGIFYLAYGTRPMGRLEPGEELKELDALTGPPPGQFEQYGGREPLVLNGQGETPGGAAGVEKAVLTELETPPEPTPAGAVPVLAGQELPPLPGNLINPVIAPITADFGWRQHPVFDDWRFHTGVDLAAPLDTPVQAVLDGTVTDIYQDPILGQVIILAHGSNWETSYGHCQDIRPEVGSYVAQGEVIAVVGETGLFSEPHLHFELRCNGQAVDPREYLPASSPSDQGRVDNS